VIFPHRSPRPAPVEAAPPAPGSPTDREPVRRPLPQSGYLTAFPAALRNLAEGEEAIRRMIGPGIEHAATIEAERHQAEAEGRDRPEEPKSPRRVARGVDARKRRRSPTPDWNR
jgi:hypothetical protein